MTISAQFSLDKIMVRGADLPLESGKIVFQNATKATRDAQNIKPGMAVKRARAQVAGTEYVEGFVKITTTNAANADFKNVMICFEDINLDGEGVNAEYVPTAASAAELPNNPTINVKVPTLGTDVFLVLFKAGSGAVTYGSNVQFDESNAGYFDTGTNDIGLQAAYSVAGDANNDYFVPVQKVN